MKHVVCVNGIRLYAHHGCLKEETAIGGHYVIDVELSCDFWLAAQHDDLSQTIDYVAVNQIVKEEMALPSKLIETVGQRIIKRIKKEFVSLEKARVKITKLSPPIGGDVQSVSIIIEE